MSTAFSRTLRSIDADGFRRWWVGIVPLGALVLVWLIWFVIAPVRVFTTSQEARIEAEQRTHVFEAPAAGRLVAVAAELGAEVSEGDLLFELDAEAQRLLLREEQARLVALQQQITGLADAIAASEGALGNAAAASAASRRAETARLAESEAAAGLAESEARRTGELAADGTVAAAESERADSEASRLRAAADAAAHERQMRQLELLTGLSDRRMALDGLRRELSESEGLAAAASAAVARLAFEVEQRSIRAPVKGRVAALPPLRVGAYIQAGEVLGSVVPDGGLTAVAAFHPSDALGHVLPGQQATVRLDGFPWTEFGTVRAEVVRVAKEPREGMIRVELSLDHDSNDRVPLQHGLPGVVEVEVGQVSPAILVLRTAGAWFSRRPESS